uniref:Uncharacterized protein n=1 Tax=Rhizophora mucronata TaxID=61149 RepID=A0A2P2R0Y3_RHIMU
MHAFLLGILWKTSSFIDIKQFLLLLFLRLAWLFLVKLYLSFSYLSSPLFPPQKKGSQK